MVFLGGAVLANIVSFETPFPNIVNQKLPGRTNRCKQ